MNLWTKKYTASVALVTILTLVIGMILWNSEDEQVLDPFDGWSRGPNNAPITLHAFPDFECHTCVEKEILAVQVLSVYPEQVRLVYHHYPDSEFSYKMAEALEVAGEQGAFWEMHDQIIKNVPEDISELNAIAEAVGLDMEQFIEELNSDKHTQTVQSAKAEAQENGVQYISLFVNDVEYEEYPGTIDDLIRAIDDELMRISVNANEDI